MDSHRTLYFKKLSAFCDKIIGTSQTSDHILLLSIISLVYLLYFSFKSWQKIHNLLHFSTEVQKWPDKITFHSWWRYLKDIQKHLKQSVGLFL
jgi:hypothetical protein